MKIAMIAPPWYRVPPRGYGGIESLVAGLVDELVALGHEVLLVCAGPSTTRAQHVCMTLSDAASDQLGDETVALLHSELAEDAVRDFRPDVVHDHTMPGLLAARQRSAPTVATVHGSVTGAYGQLLGRSGTAAMVAISRAQRLSSPAVPWRATVHNGVAVASYPFRRTKEEFLLFLGRMDADKGVTQAIEVAERTGRTLLIAARMHGRAEEAFFREHVRPHLSSSIQYIGEIGGGDKLDLLSRAAALLFPLQWEEPYGLVVAEAQACGTPVLSLRRGAIPEIVQEGRTAFLGDHHEELIRAVHQLAELSPDACRRFAEVALDVGISARGYQAVFEGMVPGRVPAITDLTRLARLPRPDVDRVLSPSDS